MLTLPQVWKFWRRRFFDSAFRRNISPHSQICELAVTKMQPALFAPLPGVGNSHTRKRLELLYFIFQNEERVRRAEARRTLNQPITHSGDQPK